MANNGEFLVNSETSGDQSYPTITGLANGGFVVSWTDYSRTLGDSSDGSIKAKIFDASGRLVKDEFLVNTETSGGQYYPTITGLANGGFVVSWTDRSGTLGDSSKTSIKAKIFDASGNVIEPGTGNVLGGDNTEDNTPPVAVDDRVTTGYKTAVTIEASTLTNNDTDADDDALTITGVNNFVGGTAVLNSNGTITFTPTDGFSGEASFDYTISDGNGGTDTATVTVTVAASTERIDDRQVVGSLSLRIEGADWQGSEDNFTNDGQGVVYIGHKDGNSQLLRIEGGEISLKDGILTVKGGTVYGEIGGVEAPLFKGDFTLDTETMKTTSLSETDIDNDYAISDFIEVDFSSFLINQDSVAFVNNVSIPTTFAKLSSPEDHFRVVLTDNGLSWGLNKSNSNGVGFDLPDTIKFGENTSLELENLGIFYDQDQKKAYFFGTSTFSTTFLGRSFTFELDMGGKDVEIDANTGLVLAAPDKYFVIYSDGEGLDWDVVGTATFTFGSAYDAYGKVKAPSYGFSIKEITLSIDTEKDTFSAKAVVGLPFLSSDAELTAQIGFAWDPFEITDWKVGIDEADILIPSTPIYLQGGSLGMENMADDDDLPTTYEGTVKASIGSSSTCLLRGTLTGTFSAHSINVLANLSSTVEYILPDSVVNELRAGEESSNRFVNTLSERFDIDSDAILDYELFSLTGSILWDRQNSVFKASGNLSVLNGFFTQQVDIFANARGDFSIDMSLTITLPDSIPIIGGVELSGNAKVFYTADGDWSNDYIAVWQNLEIGWFSVNYGFKFSLDGDFDIIGIDETKEIQDDKLSTVRVPMPLQALF